MTANDDYTRPLAGSAALVLTDVQRDFLDVPGEDPAMPVADPVRRQSIERGARIAVPGSAGSQIAAELLRHRS